jgi:hypothetical protein
MQVQKKVIKTGITLSSGKTKDPFNFFKSVYKFLYYYRPFKNTDVHWTNKIL